MIRDKAWDNFTQRGKSPANSYPYETYQHGPAAIICLASFAYAQVPEITNNDLMSTTSTKPVFPPIVFTISQDMTGIMTMNSGGPTAPLKGPTG